MIDEHERDPLLLSLSRLPLAWPNAARPDRVRARCHAALARRQSAASRRERRATLLARIADVALTAVLCGYAAVAFAQAVRLIH
jgi:hypothetical protein